jgi:hypothetical protein
MDEVEGWLNRSTAFYLAAVEVLQRADGITGDICEIGVHHGKSFLAITLGLPQGERAVAIDVFDDQHLNVDRSGKGDREVFEAHLVAHGAPAEVEILKCSSLELETVDFFTRGRRFRLFSIDGGHTSDITRNDLSVAERTLVSGGVVVLDDVLNESWLGVISGLFAYWAEGGRLIPFAILPGKALLTGTTEEAHRYQQLLRKHFRDGITKGDVPFGPNGHLVDVLGDFPWRILDTDGGVGPLAGEATVSGARAAKSRVVAAEYLDELERSWAEREAPLQVARTEAGRKIFGSATRVAKRMTRRVRNERASKG